MLEKFLYACPECKTFDALHTAKNRPTACSSCGAEFSFDGRRNLVSSKTKRARTLHQWYEEINRLRLTDERGAPPGFQKKEGEVFRTTSKKAELFREEPAGMFRGHGNLRARLYPFKKIDVGTLSLTNLRLVFTGEKTHDIGLGELSSVTIESHMVITNTKRGHAFSFEFLEESGKKWEDLIRHEVDDFYPGKRVVEYQPRIIFG